MSDDSALICQFTDITARKDAEAALARTRRELEVRNGELERSNEELTQFAYVASHDLSEPLRVIAGHVELLADRYRGRLDADADRWIGFAVDGCTRMRTLIGDLLMYSRTGREGSGFGDVDMNRVARDAARDLGATLEECHARLTIDSLPAVRGHAGQLRQVMVNLTSNATKFTKPGQPPEIHISACHEGGAWVFRVADNGIGISEQYRDRVFGIFQRLHAQGKYPGSGIGLAITKKVIDLHGGRIWVDDSPLGGCTICFTIPGPSPKAL